jgi:hypothetical protein
VKSSTIQPFPASPSRHVLCNRAVRLSPRCEEVTNAPRSVVGRRSPDFTQKLDEASLLPRQVHKSDSTSSIVEARSWRFRQGGG